MTDSARPARHPSPDELADLREGLLTGAAERDASAHVAGCADCAAEVAALDEVARLLADEGAVEVAMPGAVADTLDRAIARASAERAAGVVHLGDRRPSLATRSFRWVGAAAAVFIVGAGAVAVVNGAGSDDGQDDSTAAADAGAGDDSAAPREETDAPDKSDGDALLLDPQRVTKRTLGTFATALSSHVGPRSTPVSGEAEYNDVAHCVVPKTEPPEAAAPVRWHQRSAYVVVNTEARVATVYGCETPPERLYSTTY